MPVRKFISARDDQISPRNLFVVARTGCAMTIWQSYASLSAENDIYDAQVTPPVALSEIKRAADVVMATALLLFVLPVMTVIVVILAIDMRGKVIFTQNRGGYGGRPFKIYKFRTMRVAEDGAKIVQATRGDPRVTPVGAFLRKSSLDELPQLINVIKGDMSLVGPRPHALAHDVEFAAAEPQYAMRMRTRPGVTGLAQISGCRGEICSPEDLERRVRHDVAYIENWSVGLDMRILAVTCTKVLFDRHAY